MENITDFMKNDELALEIKYNDKKLYFDNRTREWVVIQNKKYKRHISELGRFPESDEFYAMQILVFHS